MTGVIKQNVFGLEISVDDLEPVETLKGTQKFRSVEPSPVDVKSLLFLEVVEKLSTVHKCENQI